MTRQTAEIRATLLRALLGAMFFVFAMTTDAVGSIIPKLIDEFRLTLSQASAFHYATMAAIAGGAIAFGLLADRIGRKATIVIGLAAYAAASAAFIAGDTFGVFVALLVVSGAGISVFKIGALALLGDVSTSARQHTVTMNVIEGCFGVGSIVGPAIVAVLLTAGWSWKWLYAIAAAICVALIVVALPLQFPPVRRDAAQPATFKRTLVLACDPHALGFSALIMLYVGTETAVYVWMPTLLQESAVGGWLAASALTLFFVFRAAGRFLGAWLLDRHPWRRVLALFGLAIFACFAGSLLGSATLAVYLLPLSGLFMSVLYPSLNSKGISGFPLHEHGAVAGIILFFTAIAAAVAPLAMG
ncbi:MAG TPA: MFS transporter, partial [Gammaproteobacteria bacterium]|nr:MFS transporter [Gammaproteobacteria bacterium]